MVVRAKTELMKSLALLDQTIGRTLESHNRRLSNAVVQNANQHQTPDLLVRAACRTMQTSVKRGFDHQARVCCGSGANIIILGNFYVSLDVV